MAVLVLALAAPSGNLALGIEARASTTEDISARLKSDIDKWQKVTEKAGIQKQ
jgi:tripartite-type tricarboxylate transporter receptor subunit TctC